MDTGQMLAHYRVEEKIGAGGMGEVYRAHDTVLGREVALKVLPQEFAANGERMARFQREAKVLASLNHPNIASIFGFENTGECTFLVMELVEGEDLSELLKHGAIAVDDAVDIARQVAEGLEEAHEKGIIHRDLKPANIKRTPDGKVKILDFGLARAFSGQNPEEEKIGTDPTMTAPMTMAGTIMGTAAYMSPEQARGKEVDRRTDIWAFGLVLYEMLTGHQLFAGETASDTLAGILKTDPDWNELPPDLPWQVERVLRRCLAKDPRQRLRDIGEARVRLEDPTAESGMFSGAIPIATETTDRGRRLLPWALVVVSLAAALWFALGQGKSEADRSTLHVAVPAPEEASFHVNGSYPSLPVVSPDGSHIVFGAKSETDETIRLYLRSLGAGQAVALDGTENAQYPFWSDDSQWIGFFDRNEGLKKVMVGGGPTQTICPAANAKGGSWSQANEIIFAPEYNSFLQVVAAVGGEPRQITTLEGDEGFDSHRHPQFLPDGRHFLYFARGTGGSDSELRLASLDGGDHKVIMKLSAMAQYASGHLLFLNQRTLMAQPFDPDTGQLSGEPVPVADDVMEITGAAKSAFSASSEGTLVFLRGKADIKARLVWLDRQGLELGQVSDEANYDTVVLSPDNRRAVVTITDPQAGTNDLWIIEIERNFRTRFTNHPADEGFPIWQPDGKAILFVSDRDGPYALYRQEVGGTGQAELILKDQGPIFPWGCTDDGHTVFYTRMGEKTGQDLWSVDLRNPEDARPLRESPSTDAATNLSPDGKWMAFYSEESGDGQVYLAPWPRMSPISQVSTTTGTWCVWNSNSRELIYQEFSGRLMAVPLKAESDEMIIGLPDPLFDFSTPRAEGAWFSLANDNERFLVVNSVAADPPAFCDVMINWPVQIQPR
jgi:eukaryotic-like serine/threonine-protein kinase